MSLRVKIAVNFQISPSIFKYVQLNKHYLAGNWIDKNVDSAKKKKAEKETWQPSEKDWKRICKAEWRKGAENAG